MSSSPRHALRSAPQRGLVALLALVAVALLMFARKPDALLHARFFAEDALVFFNEDRRYGVGALLRPYAGYHHLFVRIFALFAGLFDLRLVPLVYALLSLFVTIGVGAICLFANTGLSFPTRVAMALAVGCVPHGGEVLLILTNIQWIFGPALLLLVLQAPPRSRWAQVACLALIAVCGLTGPFLAIFLPVLVLKMVAERDIAPYRIVALLISLGAAFVQFRELLSRDSAKAVASVDEWLTAPAVHFVGPLFFGPSLLLDPALAPWLYIALALVGLAVLCWRAVRAQRPIALYLVLGAVIAVAAGYQVLRDNPQDLDPFVGASRYTFPPYLLLMWAICIYGFECARWRAARILAGLALLSIIVSAMMHFRIDLPPNDWPAYVARYEEDPDILIPIDPPSWEFRIAPRP